MTDRYVYLLAVEDDVHMNWDFYKIGHSSNPENRVKALQPGCPRKLFVMKKRKVGDAKKVERHLHNLFSYARRCGEWFELSIEELLQLLTEFDKL